MKHSPSRAPYPLVTLCATSAPHSPLLVPPPSPRCRCCPPVISPLPSLVRRFPTRPLHPCTPSRCPALPIVAVLPLAALLLAFLPLLSLMVRHSAALTPPVLVAILAPSTPLLLHPAVPMLPSPRKPRPPHPLCVVHPLRPPLPLATLPYSLAALLTRLLLSSPKPLSLSFPLPRMQCALLLPYCRHLHPPCRRPCM